MTIEIIYYHLANTDKSPNPDASSAHTTHLLGFTVILVCQIV